jgi:hypothetical protein
MSRYRYEEDEDDLEDYLPYAVAAAGGAGGRIIGRRLAGKAGKVRKSKKKGGGKTAQELKADRAANIGTGAGALGGYAVGKAGTDPDSVRGTLETVLAARDAARSGARWVTDPQGNPVISDAARYAALAAAGYGAHGGIKHARKALRAKKTAQSDAEFKKSLKKSGAGIGSSLALIGVSEATRPTWERRQRQGNWADVVGNPMYDPSYNRRR